MRYVLLLAHTSAMTPSACYLVLVAVAHDDAAPEAERELLEQQRLHGAVVFFVEAAVAVVCAGDGMEWR